MPDMSKENILIVGAGLGAFRLAEQLRRRGCTSAITVLGAEAHLPYDRPPLSKQVLRGENESTPFPGIEALGVEWVLGRRVKSLDASSNCVTTDDGKSHSYDTLILAPGGHPRTLAQFGSDDHIHVLRTKDDAIALRASIRPGSGLIVVGAGFIGCEIAASARQLGAEVDLIEALPAPLIRVLGPAAAAKVATLQEQQGVRIHCGAGVAQVARNADGRLCGIRLDDGREIAGDAVIVGIGIIPDIDWLAGSGLVLRDGIVCDNGGRTNITNIFALGDAAQWWHDLAGGHRRVEHWTTTTDQAAVIAANIMGDPAEPAAKLTAAPYFWSDQYNIKIQGIGFIDPTDRVDELTVKDRSVLLYSRDGVIRGVVGFSIPGAVMRMKALIERGARLEEAINLLAA
jgi:3-phenylpropionate/trans-cinnamate dioxygenase ferredoxin reductase subunit